MSDEQKALELLAAFTHGQLVALHKLGEQYNQMLIEAKGRTFAERTTNRAMVAFHRFAVIISSTGYKIHLKEVEKGDEHVRPLPEG